MHALALITTTAEHDLVDNGASTDLIESYFRKPLATWDSSILEPGEQQVVQRAFVLRAETRTIEIDREDRVVWVTYVVTVEIDYVPQSLEYFGTTVEKIIQHGCQVSFPLDERVVELVEEENTIMLT